MGSGVGQDPLGVHVHQRHFISLPPALTASSSARASCTCEAKTTSTRAAQVRLIQQKQQQLRLMFIHQSAFAVWDVDAHVRHSQQLARLPFVLYLLETATLSINNSCVRKLLGRQGCCG